MADNAYPIRPVQEDDPRFNAGLIFDIRAVLVDHGYPAVETGRDVLDLKMALWTFLYSDVGR